RLGQHRRPQRHTRPQRQPTHHRPVTRRPRRVHVAHQRRRTPRASRTTSRLHPRRHQESRPQKRPRRRPHPHHPPQPERRGCVSAPYYQDEQVTVLAGDCLEVLRTLPDASVHAVVTDPPYGLANTDPEHVAETITRWVNGDRTYLPGGSGFMGKAWDAFVPPVAVWDECLRVLKPGGHLLAFAGSRTVDFMTLGLR